MAVSDYRIRYRQDVGAWQEVFPQKEVVILGRETDADIVLESSKVSRHHARIEFTSTGIFLTDLGSTNGTLVEGQQIPPNTRVKILPQQKFMIWSFSFQIVAVGVGAGVEMKTTDASESFSLDYVVRFCLDPSKWQEFPPQKGEILIGRDRNADIVLETSEVSRRHAKLEFRPDGVFLSDLGSMNGTQIAGMPISPRKEVRLDFSQRFTIWRYTFEVVKKTGAIAERVGKLPSPDRIVAPAIADTDMTMAGAEDLGEVQSLHRLDLGGLEKVSIGRADENEMVLKHPLVSRYHAEIERIGARFLLRDLRSTNGVYLNNQRLEKEVWLNEDDHIQVGPYVFVFSKAGLQHKPSEGLEIRSVNVNQFVSRSLNLLKNINLVVKPMEFVAVVGMSGSGKTTLLNALSGYKPASDGKVLVNGMDLYKHYDLFRNDMGYVPQKDIVHAELTPYIALEYAAKLRMPPDTTPQERKRVVMTVLGELDLTERKDVPISRLSGGQLKRVSIGVELLTRPRLFFLDEPTSGLDPGTEYDMMRLMRRLADQGRTVMLVTHATKNVVLCDKVIFLARGGYVAFYGAPDDALAYFDAFRTDREKRQKEMEFDDIYRILSDETRGSPVEWGARYLVSAHYKEIMGEPGKPQAVAPQARERQPRQPSLQKTTRRISALRQLIVLSSRNLKIITQDKVSLALMLILAPGIGLMDFIWGRDLYDPVEGDAVKIITMWFMTALITVLVGSLSSVREIVKEAEIYKRERTVNLKIFPYILSKIWVGVFLALYQAGVLLLSRVIFNDPSMPGLGAYMALYITLFLCTLCGYLIGLVISASAPNQNAALLMIIAVLVPQFLFAGALLPLDLIPGGRLFSSVMPTRWAFETFINISAMGEELVDDPCWQMTESERNELTDEDKIACPCAGISIFTECTGFPGILSPDYYDDGVRAMLGLPAPVEPLQPTAYAYPTRLPSPTPLPTPTLLPSLTPYPTPEDPREMQDYMDLRQEQGDDYQDLIFEQFDEYQDDSQAQGMYYSDLLTQQGDIYADMREDQGEEYQTAMQAYGDERSEYEETRQKAVMSAEAIIETIYDNYGQAFRGTVMGRWTILGVIMLVLVIALLVFQKRKDVI